MLPTVLLTLAASFSWNADASPVYNMQPAYITANVGTTGRNIRNLPCISRKTNQSGVCMFAIDCLKANGTHLGTCIDRFYFGSCCHVEPTHDDIMDNSIETSIFPGREPPNRLNATQKPTAATTQKPTTTTRPPIILTKEPGTPDTTEVSHRLTTFQSVDGNANEIQTTTFKPPHKPKPPTLSLSTKPPSLTRPTTLKTTPASPSRPASTAKPFARPTQARPKPTLTPKPIKITKPPFKPSVTTKQPNKPLKQTAKPVKTTTRRPTTKYTPKVTQKPVNKTTIPITSTPSSVTTQKIETISLMETISRIPSPETTVQTTNFSNPVTQTTPKTQQVITKRPETKPPAPEVVASKQPETTPISTTSKPLEVSSEIPEVVTTAKVDQTTFTPTFLNSTTTLSVLTTTTMTMVTTESTFAALTSKQPEISGNDSLPSNDVLISNLNMSAVLGAVNGNVATNEIESVKPVVVETVTVKTSTTTTTTTTKKPSTTKTTTPATTTMRSTTTPTTTTTRTTATPATTTVKITTPTTKATSKTTTTTTEKPGLVTWTLPDENQPTSVVNTTSEDWIPITTPDGWVLLPSVATSTESSPAVLTTLPALVNSTQESSQAPSDKNTENTTTSAAPETSSQAVNISVNVTEPSETSSFTAETSSATTTEPSQETALNTSDFTNVCGRRMYPEGRIVGGEKSSYGKWPWQISLRQWRTSTYLHKCGAALLNENWAITAAHCVDNVPPSDLLLRLGEHDLSTELEPYLHQERRVQIVASHPQFDPRTFEYDLALLRFYEPVKFQPNIIPVCVPQTDENFVGRTAYVTGWGRLYEDGPLPSVLQEVSVPVINNTLCESMYRMAGYIEHIPHIFICAGWRRGGFDSCEGDSGGPMVIQREDKRFLLAGVISWGIGCAEPNQPGVYTRISEFRDWINQILQF